jgi:Cu(I)/Ag(I) efflux system membrane protein CusA/SilA
VSGAPAEGPAVAPPPPGGGTPGSPPLGLLARLIAVCAHHPWTVLLTWAALVGWGIWAARRAPLDAVPDLSDVQVIVTSEWMGRGPDLVEDLVTTPLTSALLSTPHVRAVRGQSMFGMSFVYVVFEDDVSLGQARVWVAERIDNARLPEGVRARMGPDATGVGWVYQYALVSDTLGPDELRTFQDWTLRYALESVPGVAEVAGVGGFQRELQVEVDPLRLAAAGLTLDNVAAAAAGANAEVGGRVIEVAGHEQVVRGHGYARTPEDLALAPLLGGTPLTGAPLPGTPAGASGGAAGGAVAAPMSGSGMSGSGMSGGSDGATSGVSSPPAQSAPGDVRRLGSVADVHFGGAQRRGVADLDGRGNSVGGIVIMRQGENALAVIQRVKARIAELSLPADVRIVPVYDRSTLIEESIHTLQTTLLEELAVVSLIVLVFLLHVRSALVPIIALPVAVILAFVPMYYQGLNANIMSLGGIAVAIGAMIDASVILVENVHKRLEQGGDRVRQIVAAMQEVGPSAFFALLVITVSFVPIFTLEGVEGRLFSPLAWTKTWSMAFAAVTAVTLVPALAVVLIRGRVVSEERHLISRVLVWLYTPIVRLVVRARWLVIPLAVLTLVATAPAALQLGSEFMPPLQEGSILYMPSTPPGISEEESQRVLTAVDRVLMSVPEVEHVFGKMGRADTATDPAPLSMAETVITLKPRDQWRPGLTWEGLVDLLDATVRVPGLPNSWWMPIQARTEMLSTGIRSPLGVRVYGDSLDLVEAAAIAIEGALTTIPGTRSVTAERSTGGLFLDVDVDREVAARLGVSVAEVLQVIELGVGGMAVGEAIDGRARFPITVRFGREFRDDPDALGQIPVRTATGALVPLARLARVSFTTGPDMLRSEGGKLVGYVFVDPGAVAIVDYVALGRAAVAKLTLPPSTRVEWAGQFEHFERAKSRLMWVVPLTLLAVALLLWLNTGSWVETAIVLLAVPFSAVGAVWLLWALDYHLSVAVWVGIIALAGLDAETGVVMLLYLKLSHAAAGAPTSGRALEDAIVDGAARRIRPKAMTVLCAMIGLLPVLWSDGTGADLMKRIAAPMVGGLVTSFVLELLVYPAIFAVWKGRGARTSR